MYRVIKNRLLAAACTRKWEMKTISKFAGMERYGDFKRIVADETAEFLANFQARLSAVDEPTIEEIGRAHV